MTAHDQIRKMLDELMGTGRDGAARKDQIQFTDLRVCRSFLLGCCPHEILANTRMDLGDCIKHHDPALRADFEKAQKEKDYYYDIDAIETLERFFEDVDRKMVLSRKRLAETQEETDLEVSEKANKVLELNESIGKTLAEAERLGEQGQVDESLKMMEKVEELRKNKRDAEQDYRNSIPASSYQQQKLRLCEVCGAFLGIHDNDRRLADHFGGKLHMGFVFLRTKLDELRSKEQERRIQRDRNRSSSHRGYGGSDRDRYYDRGGGSRDRGYDRDRRRSHDHEGSRSSKHRSKSPRRRSRSRSKSSGGSHRHRHHGKHKREKKSRSRSPRANEYEKGDGSKSRSPVSRTD